jgi:CBS domain-containing protein
MRSPSRTAPPPDALDVETSVLTDYLCQLAPFDDLPREACQRAARHMEISYVRKNQTIFDVGDAVEHLYLVRSGAVELYDADDVLVSRLGEGEFFAYPSLLTEGDAARRTTTLEDTLLYLLPEATFDALRSAHDAFDRYFNRAHAERVQAAVHERQQANVALTTDLADIIARAPVCVEPTVSIREAAQTMRTERVSSLLIRRDGRLCGVVTDRDLRNRVVADGHSTDDPVEAIMTADPITIGTDQHAFEALLMMSRHNIHHLPVTDLDGDVAGMVTTTDLIRLQADSPVFLVGEVYKQADVGGLVAVAQRLPQMVANLVEADARAHDIGHVVTTVSDALTQRLVQLGIERFGEAPVPFAWLVLGSQARHEQTAHSDQDNALLLHDDFDPDAHDAYFQDLAAFVSDGLDACGFVYCPGEVMATTDRWRQSLAAWKRTFRTWIEEPKPKALMHTSIFFDMRHGAGEASMVRELRSYFTEKAESNSIFLASLAVNALEFQPPLGFFRQFVLEKKGEHADTLNLKHRGLVPIVDLARLHGLAGGIDAMNTDTRLERLGEGSKLASSDAANLRDAFEFIGMTRLRHQARQIRRGEEPDNYVSPDSLSPFERRHLKDAFKIVDRMQDGIEQRYQTGFIR